MEDPHWNRYKYQPLDLEGYSIRLLRLKAAKEGPLECELFETWLDPGEDLAVPFEALSYTWENLDTPCLAWVETKCLPITHNLNNALLHLRYEEEDRILWIDAICIDQSNELERGHQVQQMSVIYSKADRVVVWLGIPTPEMRPALDLLRIFDQRLSVRGYKERELSDEVLRQLWTVSLLEQSPSIQAAVDSGFRELFQHPWFRRVWIIQEVACALRAVICIGTLKLRSQTFALAPQYAKFHPDEHCQTVLSVMPGPSRVKSWWAEKHDLFTLLDKFRGSQATDKRDMVYALLGIATDKHNPIIPAPDYSVSMVMVVARVLTYMLTTCANVTTAITPTWLYLSSLAQGTSMAEIGSRQKPRLLSRFDTSKHLNCGATTMAMMVAATHPKLGKDIMQALMPHVEPSDVTQAVFVAVINNRGCGQDILQFLFDYIIELDAYSILANLMSTLEDAFELGFGCTDMFRERVFELDHGKLEPGIRTCLEAFRSSTSVKARISTRSESKERRSISLRYRYGALIPILKELEALGPLDPMVNIAVSPTVPNVAPVWLTPDKDQDEMDHVHDRIQDLQARRAQARISLTDTSSSDSMTA